MGAVDQSAKRSAASVENATAAPDLEADAAAARDDLGRVVFTPSTARLPEEVLPAADQLTVLDVGEHPISVGAATASVLNYLRAEAGETRPVSPWMLYENARRYDEWATTDHEGSSLGGALVGLTRHGVCLDAEWPDRTARPDADAAARALDNRPAAIRRVERNLDHLRAAVFEHHAVLVAATLHEGWNQPSRGVIPFQPGKQAEMIGGHAFAVVGYTAEGFLVLNSWGRSWGGVKRRDRHYPGVAVWTYQDAEKNLTDAWVLRLSVQPVTPVLAGYDADDLEGEDYLEIRNEVHAFSYVLAARAIRPPLALGLFGDWGSGKSFFMARMQRKIRLLTSPSPGESGDDESPFCRNVVQIRFNAWHYLDTDLWASLVTEIFDKLFEYIRGGKVGKPEEQLPKLTEQLHAANGVYRQAKLQLAEAERARAAAEQTLKDAVRQREAREASLATQLDDVGKLVQHQPEVEKAVSRLSEDLGVPELRTSYAALEARAAELTTLGRRFAALGQAMFATPWGVARILTLVGATVLPGVVVLAIEIARAGWGVEVQAFHSFAAQLTALSGGLTAWLAAQVKRGTGILGRLEDTHRKLEVIREERRKHAVEAEQGAAQAAQEKEDAARASLQQAQQRVQAIQQEIDDLQPGRLITRFIEERTRSADYRSRLGIVSLVRRDFDRLSELADPRSEEHQPDLMPVERIILYLDDLDRCKPERVIEVLEAVHLLLAFRLFMVVVAVDPRWLSRCLEQHYPDLLALETRDFDDGTRVVPSRPATAQDYLEKIFQIPFALQPLKDDAFRRMIAGLNAGNVALEEPAPLGAAPAGTTLAGAGGAGAGGPGAAGPESAGRPSRVSLATRVAEDEEDHSALDRLLIREWELEDMRRLAPLFRTPRAVKRFVNTYRILRAGVRTHELAHFEGARGSPGTYRAAQLLLAVMVGHANVAPRFMRLLAQPPTATRAVDSWATFLDRARADAGRPVASPEARPSARRGAPAAAAAAPSPRNWEEVEWRQLCDALRRATEGDFPVAHVAELQPWIRKVARYSFALGSVAGES